MQNTATFRTVTRGAVQLVVLAAVAAIGVSVGRWVIPDDGSTGVSAVRYNNSAAPDTGQDIIERKLAQMDARDARHATAVAGFVRAPTARGADSIIERKFAEMDARDARHATAIAGPVTAPSVPGADSIIERKLAQMDALDSRAGSPPVGGDTIIDRKFAQMDAQDAR
jgi:hypothetical protein